MTRAHGAVLLLALLSGCEADPAPEARVVSEAPAPAPAPAVRPALECGAIGTIHSPGEPSEDAARANEAGLAAHEAGRFEESARLFAQAAESSSDSLMARFNRACALARLGREDEAAIELGRVLCADLPTFAPRLTSDEDLAPLRARRDVRELIAALRPRYEEAGARGMPLVQYQDGPETGRIGQSWSWSQAGVYTHDDRRFVPMGPRVRVRGSGEGPVLVATRFDPASRRVLVLSAVGNDAEGGAPLANLMISLFEAPTGKLLAQRQPSHTYYATAAFTPDGGALVSEEGDDPPRIFRLADGRATRAREELGWPRVEVYSLHWRSEARRPTDGLRIANGQLIVQGGTPIALGAGHRAIGNGRVLVSGGVAIAISASSGNCGVRDRYVVDRVDLASRSVTRLAEGDGQPHVEIGPDGAVYLQLDHRLQRLSAIGAGEAVDVRAGLVLTSVPNDYNPYC
jgi:hypothetical protein